ncbi:hypothetical protein ASZ78_014128, partial [Callipepla squamata]
RTLSEQPPQARRAEQGGWPQGSSRGCSSSCRSRVPRAELGAGCPGAEGRGPPLSASVPADAAARLAAEQEVENLSGLSPNPEKDIFVVRENRTTCLMAEFAAKFVVPYDVWASNYVDVSGAGGASRVGVGGWGAAAGSPV